MDKIKNLSRYEIEQSLLPEQLRTSRIIYLAMLLGPLFFIIVLLVINSGKQPAQGPGQIAETVQTFIYIIIALALISYSFVYYFLDLFNSPKSISNRTFNFKTPDNNKDRAVIVISIERQMMITKYALLEGISLFAIVAIVIQLESSDYQIPTDLWYLLLPVLIHTIYLILNFPTKDNTLDSIEKNVLSKLKD